MLEVPTSPLLSVFLLMFIFLPILLFFFGYLIFSLFHLTSLSSTSLFIDVYFPTSLLLPFCIFLLLLFFFFSSCHLSPLSSTSLLQVVSQIEVFTLLSFSLSLSSFPSSLMLLQVVFLPHFV
jgi:hypothetical protein